MGRPVALAGFGVVTALGQDLCETFAALAATKRELYPLTLFKVPPAAVLPVGEIFAIAPDPGLPRTHQLARRAADQVLREDFPAPDAVVVGTSTGGISRSEELLLEQERSPRAYRFHGANTVALDLARRYGCTGPVLTVSAACASGAMAIALGAAMIQNKMATRVLAGGVDGLCRLTYFGFKSLQLIDPCGARPLDRERKGMSVAEGAGFVLLVADPPATDGVGILGRGFSCDAHHAAAPHPDGEGAAAAMDAALQDAGLLPRQVAYINLHGTATPDNDRSEARALNAVFGASLPPHSSIKGAMGHSLAAGGAVEAIVCALAIEKGLLPANTGLEHLDPTLKLTPLLQPQRSHITTALSNSFGFGGSNVSLVIGTPSGPQARPESSSTLQPLRVLDYECVTGAGFLQETLNTLEQGKSAGGCLSPRTLQGGLNPLWIRRAKRLPLLTLALAAKVCNPQEAAAQPDQVVLGTGWGALSETHDFLTRLFESDCQFPSPTDFIGSVHNAPAGQIAQWFGIKGANVTVSGGDHSFEQALLSAGLLDPSGLKSRLVLGVDEAHPLLSPCFDPSYAADGTPADGGGALLLSSQATGPAVDTAFYGQCREGDNGDEIIDRLMDRLGGADQIRRHFGALWVGIPKAQTALGMGQLNRFKAQCAVGLPIIDYRNLTGHFAGAAAIAAVLCVHFVKTGKLPTSLNEGRDLPLNDKGLLMLNLGEAVSAIRIRR